ncbi:hypothetical protein [Candidatus Spongiihabitans sp.]
MCLAKPDAKRSHATRDRYLTGFPPSARMTAGRRFFPPAGENDK